MPDNFQVASDRARERTGEILWTKSSARDQANAIYDQIRAMDTERLQGES